jgi:4-diphosphocytidyl-2-C-methyl-D-erythritol kinase
MRTLHDLPAPAKLNLFLHVVGRRADGYHLLQSVFALIDWCDILHLERVAGGQISRTDLGRAAAAVATAGTADAAAPGAATPTPATSPLPAEDLCMRAARLLQAQAGVRDGVHITLEKRVPWGAGLGGGSSDAATVLLGLNQLWGLHWPRARLAALGLQLGADVPFFIGGRNAWVEGVGERLMPIDLDDARYVVLKPAVAVPTAAIFGNPHLSRDTPAAIVADFLADPAGFGRNDLQPCATAYSAEVQEAMDVLGSLFGQARMSGSGSAVFARVGLRPEAEVSTSLQRLLATVPASWTLRLCQGLGAHPLQGWARD